MKKAAAKRGVKKETVKSFSKNSIRKAYEKEVQNLAKLEKKLLKQGKSEKEIAKIVVSKRNNFKIKYRGLTPSDVVKEFEERNIKKYGNPVGPTAEQLRAQGKSWKEIIDSATRTGGHDLGF